MFVSLTITVHIALLNSLESFRKLDDQLRILTLRELKRKYGVASVSIRVLLCWAIASEKNISVHGQFCQGIEF